jgi:hypothetical protein
VELERLLAHGRGAGWLMARELGAAAVDPLLRCIVEDRRWDSQFEQRDEYYATLWLALGADPRAIVEAIAGRDRHEVWLARCVLIQLAWRGQSDALAAVVERVQAGTESDTDLELVAGMPFATRVYALAGRELAPVEPPPPRPALELDPDLDIGRLVAIMTSPRDPLYMLAARRLGELGHAELLVDAEALLRSQSVSDRLHDGSRQRRAWLNFLDRLPPALSLPRAREWFHEAWPLSLAAERILARHAEPDDRPMLEDACALALAEHDVYRLCSILDALALLAAPESIELLREVHSTIDYSHARGLATFALLPHADRADVRALMFESLWDCEAATRASGCEGVEPVAARSRLQEIAGDEFERDWVRAAAREALADEGV